ncbi:MAG: hypothetical protein KF882_03720 [Bacteroidia bacterium]|nr:hypothetical protein [Bacteroidia bacterium]MCO5254098.1 hypothetical protein [Bacteroidota bacterium]
MNHHLKSNIEHKTFHVEYDMALYTHNFSDTNLCKMQMFAKYVNDTTSEYIIEWRNGGRVIFALFKDGIQYTVNENVSSDSAWLSIKEFLANRFDRFPFWVDNHAIQFFDSTTTIYLKSDDLYYDTSRKIAIRFNQQGEAAYASLSLFGISNISHNDFVLRSHQEITNQEFDSIFQTYKGYFDKNITETEKRKQNPNLINLKSLDELVPISLFSYDEKQPWVLNTEDSLYRLIDFSFARCVPCHQAAQLLDSFALQYSHKVRYLTIDPYDKYPKDTAILNQFKHKYSHTSIMLAHKNIMAINVFDVTTFPTILLVDPQGKILFRQNGYSEDLFTTLAQYLNN